MGLLNWLFGRKGSPAVTGATEPTSNGDSAQANELEFMEISSHRFFGSCTRSGNGRFVLAWSDANEAGTEGGYRRSGHGRYFLMEGSRVLAHGKMARPNDGKVADDGTFILNDWGFGHGLKGKFHAFRPNGESACVQKFKANLFNNGLSSDGRFAACHTCNSDDDKDSSVLTIFDLARGTETARWRPASGWPNFYEFSKDGATIGLGYPRLGVFGYTMAGEFLDRAAWEEARLTKGEYGDVLMMSQDLIRGADSKPAPELAARIIGAIDRVLPGIRDKNW